jgi:hypothetical protein
MRLADPEDPLNAAWLQEDQRRLDIQLPVLDRYDATRQIKVLPGSRQFQSLPSVPSP